MYAAMSWGENSAWPSLGIAYSAKCRFAIRRRFMWSSCSFQVPSLSLLAVVVRTHIVPRAAVVCPVSSFSPDIFPPSRSRGSLILLQHDILSCGGGWCTRGRQRQRWPNGRSCQRVSTTFLVMLLAAENVRTQRGCSRWQNRRGKEKGMLSGGRTGKVATAYLEKRRCFGRWS